MKIIEIRCPHCGGELHIGEDRKECFCEYCGSHLMFDDGDRTIINVIRDEARLKEAEIESEKIKKKEAKEKRASVHRKRLLISFVVWLALFIAFFILTDALNVPFSVSKVFLIMLVISLIYLIIYGFVVLVISTT